MGSDGLTARPPMTFTYGHTAGSGYYANGSWNRLIKADNGQGGTLEFSYENIGAILAASGQPPHSASQFKNYRRVTARIAKDGRGNSYSWSYAYDKPAVNSMGTQLDPSGSVGENVLPNSATVYFGDKLDPSQLNQNRDRLVHRRHKEFRGHKLVVETDPNGNATEHFFYQGDPRPLAEAQQHGDVPDVECAPAAVGDANAIRSDPCFVQLRDRELLKGREYRTITHAGPVSLTGFLTKVKRYFTVDFRGYGELGPQDDTITGLWRAFVFESATTEIVREGEDAPATRTTLYEYELTYGNLAEVEEHDESGLLRRSVYNYATLDNPSSYIVDRRRSERVFDAAGNMLARTIYGYDGSLGPGTLTIGDLTLVRKYFDIPVPVASATVIHSSDISYSYDSYGNRTGVTTYMDPGEGTAGGSSFGPAGGATPRPRTTITQYDPVFHDLPVQVDPPAVNSVVLSESATYSPTLRVIMTVTDPNGNISRADYDKFGRMIKLARPGDSLDGVPTAEFKYWDYAQPFRYEIFQFEAAGNPGLWRPTIKYYDGLGREIQTKSESADLTQNIVVDRVFDGLGQLVEESQPRYVNQAGGDFWLLAAQGTEAEMRWTSTQYDALGRPTQVQAPDTNKTINRYAVRSDNPQAQKRRVATTTDANGHRTRRESDMFGRLIAVQEYSGNGGSEGIHLDYSRTTYGYSPLDLLVSVSDGNGTLTSIGYDSLGRKTSMSDPTMGNWSYSYDPNGNLRTQTDAKGQTITFDYDALDRLTGKTYPAGAGDPAVYSYDGAGVPNGKGQRTAMARGGLTTSWQYDARGQEVRAEYSAAELGASPRVFQQAYDSGGRLSAITYPGGEVVSYSYDAAWRQTSACSNQYTPCYATGATYTALDQPQSFTLGNGLGQSYNYNNPMARLQSLQVGPGGGVFSRGYTYDGVGNVDTVTDALLNQTHDFSYDHRDRLTGWTMPGVTESYSYDKLGNILSKAGVSYSYGPGNGGPYALRSTSDGHSYTYDANGNMLAGAGRTYSWNAENQPTAITTASAAETYNYDADGERFKRTVGSTSTYYLGGLYEEDLPDGTKRFLYQFAGQVVAQREVRTGSGGAGSIHSRRGSGLAAPAARLSAQGCTGVSWANMSNVSASGNSIQKTTSSTNWDAGATSSSSISSGDLYAQATANRTNTYTQFGIGDSHWTADGADIDFSVRLSAGTVQVFEFGVQKGSFGSYVVGDVFKVALVSGVVKYYKNGTLFYTTKIAPSYPMHFDSSIAEGGISDAYLCPTTSTAAKSALFVVASVALNNAEVAVRDRLVGMGYSLSFRDDDLLQPTDHAGKDLVLISSTVDPANVDTRFTYVGVPVPVVLISVTLAYYFVPPFMERYFGIAMPDYLDRARPTKPESAVRGDNDAGGNGEKIWARSVGVGVIISLAATYIYALALQEPGSPDIGEIVLFALAVALGTAGIHFIFVSLNARRP